MSTDTTSVGEDYCQTEEMDQDRHGDRAERMRERDSGGSGRVSDEVVG